MGGVTFERARPIVEARLYAYAALKREYPDAPISSLHNRLGASVKSVTSPQERWATRYASEIKNAVVIERVLATLPKDERRLVEMRYLEFARWEYVCRELSVSRATAYRIRDRALMAFAYAFGLVAYSTVETL